MPPSLVVNRLQEANVYLNGNSLLGQTSEIKLPEIVHKYSDHKALGMVSEIELWSSLQKMDAEFKWNSYYPDTMIKCADPFAASDIQVRSSLRSFGAGGAVIAEKPVVIFLKGTWKQSATGDFKQGDPSEINSKMAVKYMRQVVDGKEIIEVDVFANIFKVNGFDVLEQYRQNLGI